ncbi:non-ribosomal peptide synthetase [Kibdelosporangium aridum]|uniref:non-ribosomal peptide synthetase n=1 Tax=Kibdelosporangium aridum TaxID=2030 RepID=UPI0035F07FD9
MAGLLDQIYHRCRSFPDDVIVSGDQDLTAEKFWHRVVSLSEKLRDAGLEPGERIAVAVPPSAELVYTIAATWLADAAFVPMDLREATARRTSILHDAQVRFIVVPTGAWADLGWSPIATLSNGLSLLSNLSRSAQKSQFLDEAYVIFTSGSTGRPKGVSVSHRSIASYVNNAAEALAPISRDTQVVAHQTPTFDGAWTCLLLPLISRHPLFPIAEAGFATKALAEFLQRNEKPVLVKTTPSQLALLRDLLEHRHVQRLSGIFVLGGEALDYSQISWLRSNSNLAIYNEYGPTEATIGTCLHRVSDGDAEEGPVPIGLPYPGNRCWIKTSGSRQQGDRLGELVIEGAGVANGYIQDFGEDRFVAGAEGMQYHSGDWVRQDVTGQLWYLGRKDEQLKLNGYRIELGEVEAALSSSSGGRRCVALVVDNRLIGIVEGGSENLESTSASLRTRLPTWMMPTELANVPALPRTPHGKVDRRKSKELIQGLGMGGNQVPGRIPREEHSATDRWSAVAKNDNATEAGEVVRERLKQKSSQSASDHSIAEGPEPITAHEHLEGEGNKKELGENIAQMATLVIGHVVTVADDLLNAGAQSLELLRLAAAITRRYQVPLRVVDFLDYSTPGAVAERVIHLRSTNNAGGHQ